MNTRASVDKEQKFHSFKLNIKQTRMLLKSDDPGTFGPAKQAVIHNRGILEEYIIKHPEFGTSIEPLEVDLLAPEFVRTMMAAGLAAEVGPMAAVAGGLAEIATDGMIKHGCRLALADNGGDISIKGSSEIVLGVYAGESSVAKKIGFRLLPSDLPLGICTSAGTLGHSISFGDADAVTVISRSTYLADAAATAVANKVKKTDPEGTIQNALEIAEEIEGVLGCMIFIDNSIGTTGWLPRFVELIDE